MPIIPELREGEELTVKHPVPIASPADRGAEGAGLQAIGGAFEKIGQQAQVEEDKLQAQKDQNDKLEGMNALQNAYKVSASQAERASAPDGSDIHDKFAGAYQPQRDAILNNYKDNPGVAQSLNSFERRISNDAQATMTIAGAQKLENNNLSRYEENMYSMANTIRENPSEAMTGAQWRTWNSSMDEAVSSGTLSAEKADRMRDAAKETFGQQLVSGWVEKGDPTSLGKALNVLKANAEDPNLKTSLTPQDAQRLGFISDQEAGALSAKGQTYDIQSLTKGSKVELSPELSQVMDGMKPSEKAHMIEALQAKIKERTTMNLGDLHATLDGFQKNALDPGGKPHTDQDVQAMLSRISSNTALTPSSQSRLKDEVIASDAISKQIAVASMKPRSEQNQMADGIADKIKSAVSDAAVKDPSLAKNDSDWGVAGQRLSLQDKFSTAITNMQKWQDHDSADFILTNDSQAQALLKGTKDQSSASVDAQKQFFDYMVNKNNYLQIPADKQKIVPPDMRNDLAAGLKAAPSADDTLSMLSGMQKKYGEYYPRVLSEVAGNDKDLQALGAALYAPPDARGQLVDAIRNRTTIFKTLKEDPAHAEKQTLVRGTIDSQMRPLQGVLADSSNDSSSMKALASMDQAVELVADRNMARNPKLKPDEAAKQAYDSVVGSQYSFESGGNSKTIVPKTIDGKPWDTSVVSSFLDTYSSKENLQKLNPAVPKNYDNPDSFYKNLEEMHRWVPNSDQSGMRLMQVDRAGQMQPVYDKYQHVIEQSYDDLRQNPDKATMKTHSEIKTMFGRFNG